MPFVAERTLIWKYGSNRVTIHPNAEVRLT